MASRDAGNGQTLDELREAKERLEDDCRRLSVRHVALAQELADRRAGEVEAAARDDAARMRLAGLQAEISALRSRIDQTRNQRHAALEMQRVQRENEMATATKELQVLQGRKKDVALRLPEKPPPRAGNLFGVK